MPYNTPIYNSNLESLMLTKNEMSDKSAWIQTLQTIFELEIMKKVHL